jgi:PIN domain nuclease of toxin-antitoxin system
MSLLLDTHVVLWWLLSPNRLRSPLRKKIAQTPGVFVSAASVWEASIKVALGKLEMPDSLTVALREEGFRELPITFRHAEEVTLLPDIHKDPFDRMLIAQARAEALVLVTNDETIRSYAVPTLWL